MSSCKAWKHPDRPSWDVGEPIAPGAKRCGQPEFHPGPHVALIGTYDPTTDAVDRANDERARLRAENELLRKMLYTLVQGGAISVSTDSEAGRLIISSSQPSTTSPPKPTDYTSMTAGELVTACGDSADRWARAFVQHARKSGGIIPGVGDEDYVSWVMGWFANAIETACDKRERRQRQVSAVDRDKVVPIPRNGCKACGGTGVIETGNNDHPCDCQAGDEAIFNVAGGERMTGAELKRRRR